MKTIFFCLFVLVTGMSVDELHQLNAQLLMQIQSKCSSLTFCYVHQSESSLFKTEHVCPLHSVILISDKSPY